MKPERPASVRTARQRIALAPVGPGGPWALYLDGAIQFVEGADDTRYHRTLADEPLDRLERARFGGAVDVLILGGGDGLAARNLLRRPEVRSVTLVEIDPGMVRFCANHPVMRRLNEDALRSPRLRVVCEDARRFLARRPERLYDLALVDFTDPTPGALDLYGPALYAAILSHLRPDALLAVQASASRSPTEEHVASVLARVTGRPVERLRFRGLRMADGVVVLAERGSPRAGGLFG